MDGGSGRAHYWLVVRASWPTALEYTPSLREFFAPVGPRGGGRKGCRGVAPFGQCVPQEPFSSDFTDPTLGLDGAAPHQIPTPQADAGGDDGVVEVFETSRRRSGIPFAELATGMDLFEAVGLRLEHTAAFGS
jgi:hypothetical protein